MKAKPVTVWAVIDTREGMSDVVSLHTTRKGAEKAKRQAREDDPDAKRGAFTVYEYTLTE